MTKSAIAVGLAVIAAVGCKKAPAEGPDAAVTIAAAVIDAGPPPACSVDVAPFVVDHGVRLDTGITLVKLSDGRHAVGYAVGDVPKAAVVDSAGKPNVVDVDVDHLTKSEKAPQMPGATRTIMRVTPLGSQGDLKMRVGVDLRDRPDAVGYLRCGPADGAPLIEEGQASQKDARGDTGDDGFVQDCRTFTDGATSWVLASSQHTYPVGTKTVMRWLVDVTPGHAVLNEAVIEERDIDENKATHEPFAYEVPVGVGVPGAGFIFASRYKGELIVAKRNAKMDKSGEPSVFKLGVSPTMAALAMSSSHKVALLVAAQGKTELLGSEFVAEAKPKKPEKLTLDDPSPPSDGDRTSVSASFTPSGDLFVGFVDGKGAAHKSRVAMLGSDLKSKMRVYDVTAGDTNVSEARILALPDGKLLVMYLEAPPSGAYALTGTILKCPAPPK